MITTSEMEVWMKEFQTSFDTIRENFNQFWALQDFSGKCSKASCPIPDRRLSDPAWDQNPFLNFYKQFYLLGYQNSLWWIETFYPEEERDGVKFLLKNFLDFLSPANVPWLNPAVIQETIAEKGENLKRGFENFLKDQEQPMAWGMPSMTQFGAFKVGENLATTPGKVIFENRFCQLIYYTPVTPQISQRPILIVPPWINKFYIFDLTPETSFVKWNLQQGRPIFVLSWVNPDASYGDVHFSDYILGAIHPCIEEILRVTQESQVNLLGYCVGGVAVCSLLSYYAQSSIDYVKSVTLLASPIDFEMLREFNPFRSKKNLQALEKALETSKVMPGPQLVRFFSFLKATDLVWSNAINNYFLGKNPPKIPFLYWNSDTANIPGKLHLEYLRYFFMDNVFLNGSDYRLNGFAIDLKEIKTPILSVGTKNDHIVPWASAYALRKVLPHAQFLLAGSGHVAGIMNPPTAQKYSYWVNDTPEFLDPEKWLEQAVEHAGSWWKYWNEWMKAFDGEHRAPFTVSNDIEPAPGRYVLMPLPIAT